MYRNVNTASHNTAHPRPTSKEAMSRTNARRLEARRRADPVLVEADRRGARCDAGELADRPPGLPGVRRYLSGGLGARRRTRPVCLAGRHRRCRSPIRLPRGTGTPSLGDRWNIFGLVDFTIAVGIGLATAPSPFQVDRAEHPEYRGRALSGRPDPGLCGAELDLAARAVVAPAAPSLALKARAQPGLTSG